MDDWSEEIVNDTLDAYMDWLEEQQENAVHGNMLIKEKEEACRIIVSKKTAVNYLRTQMDIHPKIPLCVIIDTVMEAFHEWSKDDSCPWQNEMYYYMYEAVNDIESLLMDYSYEYETV